MRECSPFDLGYFSKLLDYADRSDGLDWTKFDAIRSKGAH